MKDSVVEVPTFYSGEEIRIELELRDESGVGQVLGVFTQRPWGGEVLVRKLPASSALRPAAPAPRLAS